MGGTNDVIIGRPWELVQDDLRAVTAIVGARAVLLSAVPPNDDLPEATTAFNDRLRTLAAEQGWRFVDPWTGITREGAYRPGASLDGVHPTQRAADEAGAVIREVLLDGAGG
jgi:hypothetical protein